MSIIFSYAGYYNAFNMTNEIKNPIPTLKKNGIISLGTVAILYMLCNIAYFATVSKAEFAEASEIAAAVFFSKLFGESKAAANVLNFLVLLSAFGNLLAVLIGSSRMIREIGRQGVLPFTEFWVSTKPFGTPLGPYLLKWAMTFIMIVAPPAGDAFSFGIFALETIGDRIEHGMLTSLLSRRPPDVSERDVQLCNDIRRLHPETQTQTFWHWPLRLPGLGLCCSLLLGYSSLRTGNALVAA